MIQQIQGIMLELLAKGTDIQTLIDRSASLLHNPVLVADTRFRIPYMSRTEQKNIELWTKAKADGYISDGILEDLQKDGTIQHLTRTGGPIRQTLPNGFQSVRYPVWNRGKYCGFVGMYDYITPFTDESIEALSAVAKALSAVIPSDSNFVITENQNYEEELFQLLCCETVEQARLVCSRLKKLNLPQWKTLCLITAHKQSKVPLGRLKEILQQQIAPPAMTLYEDGLVLLFNSFSENGRPNTAICDTLEKLCDSFHLSLARSFPYEQAAFTRLAYTQALFCLQNTDKSGQTDFETMYPMAIRSACTAIYPAEYFIHPVFLMLKSYDEQYGLDYFETLVIFLNYQGNMKAVSEHLGLHYNTVKHRIAMIETIIGQKLRNNPRLLHILSLSLIFFSP